MREHALAVDPCIEESIRPRRPTHVVDEVVPHVLLNLPDHGTVATVGGSTIDASIADELQPPGLGDRLGDIVRRLHGDVEVGLSGIASGVVEIEEDIALLRRDDEVVREEDRVCPPLLDALAIEIQT